MSDFWGKGLAAGGKNLLEGGNLQEADVKARVRYWRITGKYRVGLIVSLRSTIMAVSACCVNGDVP